MGARPPAAPPHAVNWWKLWHDAMNELHWLPEQIGRLTLTQLACLVSVRPPGAQHAKTLEEYESLDVQTQLTSSFKSLVTAAR